MVGEVPDLLGLHFDAGDAIHQYQGRIGRYQGGAGIVDENVVAGSIEDIDLGFLPLRHGDGSGNGDFAGDFLLVEIGDGVALIDAQQPVGRPRAEQHARGERRLAGIAVAHQTDVPDILALVDLHAWLPVDKTE